MQSMPFIVYFSLQLNGWDNKQIFTSWEFNFQQFWQILIKFSLFSARAFVNYFVPNISRRYGNLDCDQSWEQ
jgi:hypothetical protein